MFPASLFRRKGLDRLVGETIEPEHQLKRALGPLQLTLLGIGAIIGAGIFSTVGTAAAGASAEAGASGHLGAGPALVLSFVLDAVACGFAALCYAEFASMVPVSGSAYTYSYATLGELIAWIIGWDLILEYAVGNVAVAISWSDYFHSLLAGFKLSCPAWLGTDYRTALQAVHDIAKAKTGGIDPSTLGDVVARGGHAWADAPRLLGLPIIFNLPAVLIVAFITWVLVRGIKESAGFNSAMVVLKLVIIAFFVGVGACYVKPANWMPFAPNGFAGIRSAASIIFFAYIGFDAVSTAAEETRNPERDVPIGIIASLAVCTVIYIAVALVLTGMVRWDQFKGVADPLAKAFSDRGMNWTAGLISFGAVFATTSVLLVFQLGQPRIFFSMARDGLLPPWAAKVHPRYRTPHVTTILTGVCVAVFAAVTNINEVVELCNIGTLFAFVLVAAGIIVLRRTDPGRPRPFRTPLVPLVPLAAIGCCAYLMADLPMVTWVRFVVWLAGGLLIYFGAGVDESKILGLESRRTSLQEARVSFSHLLITGLGLSVLGGAIWLAFRLALTGSNHALGITVTVFAALVAYAGLVLWVRGCACYAVAKGYSRWLGLVGIFSLVGLGIVAALPPRHSTPAAGA
jgi:basic amino acid/polyamine antiporter, APA family